MYKLDSSISDNEEVIGAECFFFYIYITNIKLHHKTTNDSTKFIQF